MKIPNPLKIFQTFDPQKPICGTHIKEAVITLASIKNGKEGKETEHDAQPTR